MKTSDLPYRRSIRLAGYDYSSPGGYFITLVAHQRACLFGQMRGSAMVRSPEGDIIAEFWQAIPVHFPNIELGAFVVMPNHVHGIIIIHEFPRSSSSRGDVSSPENHPTGGVTVPENHSTGGVTAPENHPTGGVSAPAGGRTPPLPNQRPTLGQVVGFYKYQTTKQVNILRNSMGVPLWQRNYYEHIIRNEVEHRRIVDYIESNISNWEKDVDNP